MTNKKSVSSQKKEFFLPFWDISSVNAVSSRQGTGVMWITFCEEERFVRVTESSMGSFRLIRLCEKTKLWGEQTNSEA